MSIILTECGWVELGAANPLERAYETAGRDEPASYRLEGRSVLDNVVIDLVRCPMYDRFLVCSFCERPLDVGTHLNCLHPTVLTV